MTHAIWGNIDQQIVEQLMLRAQRNGRSLHEEIKAILEEVAAAEARDDEHSNLTQRAENQQRLRQVRGARSVKLFGMVKIFTMPNFRVSPNPTIPPLAIASPRQLTIP